MVVGRSLGFVVVAFATLGIRHACEVGDILASDPAPRAPPLAARAVAADSSAAPTTAAPPPPAASAPARLAPPPEPVGPPEPEATPCPDEMVLVEGMYCPEVKQICKRWMDPPSSPYGYFRCAEYDEPATCVSPARVQKRFCIDREEYVRPGDSLPLANQSWTSAARICAADGKRLCLESEWQFACEGEEMRPYPYGFSRDKTACNIDQPHLGKPQTGLTDLRAPVSAYPDCLSPFGVHDMSGNVEEWATLDRGKAPDRSTMKGAWWLPGKNNCRAATLGHGETYEGPQVGVRCCKEAE